MTFTAILWLAIGLAMDAAAVSAARGVALDHFHPPHALRVALYFGGAQAVMPLLGALVGAQLGPFLQAWTHWIAFTLLSAIGGKLLWEGFHADAETTANNANAFSHKLMLSLAIATSIDALAVGVTLPMLRAPLLLTITTIGLVTALLSVLGLALGHRFGHLLGKRFDIVGGVVLIALGIKILFVRA